MKGVAARDESTVRKAAINIVGAQLVGVTERSIHDRIRKGMSNEGKSDPRNISLYLVSTWLSQNNLETFFSSDELIDIVAKDTKLNRSIVKRLFKEIPFKIPSHLKPVKIKKVKNKKKPSMAIVNKGETPELMSTLEVTVPPRELAYFSRQDQVAIQNKKEVRLTTLAKKILDKYGEQISFIVNQLKGESLESIAQKIANSLTASKKENGTPQDTPLFQIARWFSNNRDNLPDNRIRLVDNIVNDTDVIRNRIKKLLGFYDFGLPDFDAPKEPEVKVVAEVKPERPKKAPQLKVAPSISTEDGGWIETHIGAEAFKKEEVEKIELDPSIEKQYILSGPGIEIVIKTGGDKISVAPESEDYVNIKTKVGKHIDVVPEGHYAIEIDGYIHKRCDDSIKASYCYVCKKSFTGKWLCVVRLYDELGTYKAVPCHAACVHGKRLFIKNRHRQG